MRGATLDLLVALFRRNRPTDDIGSALEEFASLLRCHPSARAAAREWAAARRDRSMLAALDAGWPLDRCVSAGLDPAPSLAAACALHRRTALDLAAMVDLEAAQARARRGGHGAALAHAAGARLSARMIAALPLVSLPFLPAAGTPARPVATLVVMGLALTWTGIRWIERLLPEAPGSSDPYSQLANTLSFALRAGGFVTVTLTELARARVGPGSLVEAHRQVLLGRSWSEAMRASPDPRLRTFADLFDRSARSGAPVAERLRAHGAAIEAEAQRLFEADIRRAPVRMVLPLTCCVLPAFALLGIAPYLLVV